jgi:hypothetical protein
MMNEEDKDKLVESAVTLINLQSKDFDESCQKLYESIKAGCSTYGEVQDCIYRIGYNRAFKGNGHTSYQRLKVHYRRCMTMT